MELHLRIAGHEGHAVHANQGIVVRDAASQTPNPPAVPARRIPADETVARMRVDQLDLLTERINVLERLWEEVKTRAREAEQRNKDLQQENRTLNAEVRKLTGQARDLAETSRRAHP